MSHQTLLSLRQLSVTYGAGDEPVRAVRDVSLDLFEDEIFGLVGESGSGKSTLGLAVLRLLPDNAATAGEAWLADRELMGLDDGSMRRLRWSSVAYIPQGAMNSLNPVMRIRPQFVDVLADHQRVEMRRKPDAILERALAAVNLPPRVLDRYPHELSGGMKQRVCIALAMILRPQLIIADEPTSALDVVSQRRVIEALAAARGGSRATVLLIGHDMALQAQAADRIGIMYAGRLLEVGPTASVFRNPLHPYTQKLISAVPSIRERVGIRQLARESETVVTVPDGGTLVEAEPGHLILRPEVPA